ncbi:MAG: DUF4301 family protein, partial [Smithella sp.]
MKKTLKNNAIFSRKDIQQIGSRGLELNEVERQLATYRKGPRYVNLQRPCVIHDGILSISPAQRNRWIALYEKESAGYKLLKFVPASGAASRMFAEWFHARTDEGFGSVQRDQLFIRNLKKHPFYCLISKNRQIMPHIRKKNIKIILDYILSPEGLNYGRLPKALIPFHLYGKGEVRTALEEHLVEGAHYLRSQDNICHLHFTVSPEHKKNVIEKIKAVQACYENIHRIKYKISLSVQSPATDILAVDEKNLPFKDDGGNLVFRPGGH